ncbi:MAG: Rieske 2Fe-2S domain-containing protein [Candidatus Acidiferrales bacterium]
MNFPEQPLAEDSRVTRRGFGRWLGLGAALAALSGFAIYWRERKVTYPVKVVARAGEISVGGSLVFPYPADDRPCFLLRPAEDTYLAFSRLCTHHTCPVFYRPEQNVFACPCHGGIFSATDGRVLDGPPPKPLPEVILERRDDEIVATGFVQSS